MPSPRKGKAKENPARTRKVATKEKATQAKVTEKRQHSTRASMVSVETAESMDTKSLTVGTSSTSLKTKARTRRHVKATTVNELKRLGHQHHLHTSSLSQVNTIREIGCADEGLWIFSLEDSEKLRHIAHCELGGRKSV